MCDTTKMRSSCNAPAMMAPVWGVRLRRSNGCLPQSSGRATVANEHKDLIKKKEVRRPNGGGGRAVIVNLALVDLIERIS